MRVLIRSGDKVVEIDSQQVPATVSEVVTQARELWRILGFVSTDQPSAAAPTQQFTPFGR
jgi:hypothetical protein